MPSIFTKIINGELPSYKIYEDKNVFSFLALDQLTLGHTLLIPKKEIDYWINVPEADYLELQKMALKLGKAIQDATGCRKVFQTVIGLEVPHFHLHLIPGHAIGDLNFSKAMRHPEAEMKEIQRRIIEKL